MDTGRPPYGFVVSKKTFQTAQEGEKSYAMRYPKLAPTPPLQKKKIMGDGCGKSELLVE